MDFRFTEQQEAFRKEISEFAMRELPPGWVGSVPGEEYGTEEGWELAQQMARKLAERGWLTISWPKEYGGRGASNMEQFIYREVMTYYRVPGIDMGPGSVGIVAPPIMLFGSEQQKMEHLPKMAAGEKFWSIIYSEPGAGSDMSALQCRATRDGDDYIINGQKVWITAGQRSHWGWLAARTDPDAPKHKGLSMFLVDMKSPGITVRPLTTLAGSQEFCEVFFDDVRVPKANLLGEENRGWQYLMVALDFERGLGVYFVSSAKRMVDELVGYVKEAKRKGKVLANEAMIRHRLAEMAVECEVGRLICYRIAWMLDKGLIPNYEASMAKNFGCELRQRVANLGMQLAGLHCQLEGGSKWAGLSELTEREYLCSIWSTLYLGTSEINRNIIATRGLGLPR